MSNNWPATAATRPPDLPDGMLTGVVLRPPALTWDGAQAAVAALRGVDVRAAEAMPGVVRVVHRGAFLGLVAVSPVHARDAAARLRPEWTPRDARARRGHAATRTVLRLGDDTAETSPSLAHTYQWPAPSPRDGSWVVAWWFGSGLKVWAPCETAGLLRAELAACLDLPPDAVEICQTSHAPVPGAFDAAADAALLSAEVGRPVRVTVDGGGADALLQTSLSAGVDATGRIRNYVAVTDHAPWPRPSIARLLSGSTNSSAVPGAESLPPYAFEGRQIQTPIDMPLQSVDTSAGVLNQAHVFAHESFMDESAFAGGACPVAFRLAHLQGDERATALVNSVARRAGWDGPLAAEPGMRRGRGFALASLADAASPQPRRALGAWVVEVAVAPDGDVQVTRVVAGHDDETSSGSAVGDPGAAFCLEDAARRWLARPDEFDTWPGRDRDALPAGAATPAAGQGAELATARQDALDTPLAWDAAAQAPAAAAVANAIFDATGVRLRSPWFQAPQARALLACGPGGPAPRRLATWLGAAGVIAAGAAVSLMPWRTAIAPVTPDLSVFSQAAVERGRLVAAAGDCRVCHTVPGGAENAGGLRLDTPFGTIVTTNITPDPQTGIGSWSFQAFERAMRQGIHQDGRHLYPAFPYTAYAKLTEGDMQSLYAYLMTREPVASRPPPTELAFPFNVRPLMAGWNTLFHQAGVYTPDPTQTLAWNRGAYLVQGAGHCGACHTPRNALGAEKQGPANFLAGGVADGWTAPALNGSSASPLAWTEDDFFQYLRVGHAPRHGAAAGPMAPVVSSLSALPDADIRAMAIYLASLAPVGVPEADPEQILALETRSDEIDLRLKGLLGTRIFHGACAACHEAGTGPTLLGSRPSLALNTNLHSDSPDNLLQVIVHGINQPAMGELGYMPGFGDSLSDTQIAAVASYMRARFAPDRPAWQELESAAARIRSLTPPAH